MSPAAACQPLLDAGYAGWRIDHSPGATRRAAYRRGTGGPALLQPLDLLELDTWPHLLWTSPRMAFPTPAGLS